MTRTAFWIAAALLIAAGAAAAEPRIIVQMIVDPGLGFSFPDGGADSLESKVQGQIRREFPCVSCTTPHDLRNLMGFLRMRALLGVPDDQQESYDKQLLELGGAFGADYIISLHAMAVGSRWSIFGLWLDVRKAKALARASEETGANGDALIDACDKIAKKLIEEAAYFEICPYLGPVKMRVRTTRSQNERVEYPVSCNGGDYQYVRTMSLEANSDSNIELTRTNRPWATGTYQYRSKERQVTVEQDPCYNCASGRKGGRTLTDNHTTTSEVTGLSEDSSTTGQNFTDARLYLKFAKDGTYTLELVAASKPGTRTVHIERKAEGTCDTHLDNPREDYTTKVDIPVGNIMGPFRGGPMDKSLADHKEFHSTNPVTKEETTITVEFKIRRG